MTVKNNIYGIALVYIEVQGAMRVFIFYKKKIAHVLEYSETQNFYVNVINKCTFFSLMFFDL